MAARKRRHDAYGLAVTLLAASGCMIGPDYARPPAPTAGRWIEAEHAALRTESADTPRWWGVFGDPVLGRLVAIAHAENLTLRAAGLRVLQAQARHSSESRATVAMAALQERHPSRPFTILGTGFCIHPRGIVVTCRHVVEAFYEKTFDTYIQELPAEERTKQVQELQDVRSLIPHALFYVVRPERHEVMMLPCRGRRSKDRCWLISGWFG